MLAPSPFGSFWFYPGARFYHADAIPTLVSDLAVIRQRRSVLQPRVARPALPWVISPTHPNPNGVASRGRRGGTPLGFMRLVGRSQGRPHFIRPTLGWRAESLWDKRSWLLRGTVLSRRCHSHPCQRSRRNTPTSFRPPAKGGVLRQRWSSLQSRLRLYANGVPSSSPGLRGLRYPGSSPPRTPTPTGLRPGGVGAEPPWGSCAWSVDPRVGLISFGQPWAGGRNPFGIEDRGFSGARFYHADAIPTLVSDLAVIRQRRSVLHPKVGFYANGGPPFSPSCVFTPTAFRPPAKGGVLRQRWSSLQSRLRLYANGVPSSSPGLRGLRYPGSSPPRTPTPTGLRPGGVGAEPPWGSCAWSVDPRVGLISFGQPWAGGRNPFGIEDRGFSGARFYHADAIPTLVSDLAVIRQRRSVLQPKVGFYANGGPPFSPGCVFTPTAFRPPAQGCAACATLGHLPHAPQPQRGCVPGA
jgi:hypothetical protein